MRGNKRGDTHGLKVPWAYIRREIAKSWYCKPSDVDEADPEDIRIELRIRHIVGEVEREP